MRLSGDYVVVKMEDRDEAVQQFDNGDIISVDLGLAYAQHDVTGFGDDAQNFISGQLQAPVTIRGYLTTTPTTGTHTLLSSAYQSGRTVQFEVHVGKNAPPSTNDPKFWGDFIVDSYRPSIENGNAVTFVATLKPASLEATNIPVWDTVA
jgi:hypothetical protein